MPATLTQLYVYKNNFNYVYSEKEPKNINLVSQMPTLIKAFMDWRDNLGLNFYP